MDGNASTRAALRDRVGEPGTLVRLRNGHELIGVVEAVSHEHVSMYLPLVVACPGRQQVPIAEVALVGPAPEPTEPRT